MSTPGDLFHIQVTGSQDEVWCTDDAPGHLLVALRNSHARTHARRELRCQVHAPRALAHKQVPV